MQARPIALHSIIQKLGLGGGRLRATSHKTSELYDPTTAAGPTVLATASVCAGGRTLGALGPAGAIRFSHRRSRGRATPAADAQRVRRSLHALRPSEVSPAQRREMRNSPSRGSSDSLGSFWSISKQSSHASRAAATGVDRSRPTVDAVDAADRPGRDPSCPDTSQSEGRRSGGRLSGNAATSTELRGAVAELSERPSPSPIKSGPLRAGSAGAFRSEAVANGRVQ